MAGTGRLARTTLWNWAFVLLMLGLTGLFVTLGLWQLDRLAEKQAQIAAVAASAGRDPAEFPDPAGWAEIDAEAIDFSPMRVTGTYDSGQTVLVFDNLSRPEGRYRGAGYWVMTPVRLEGGQAVWINRGFVPQELAGAVPAPPEGLVTVEGLVRRPERPNPFTPAPDPRSGREWVRDPARLSAMAGLEAPVAPLYLDRFAGEPGELPQGGETEVTFSNRHLEYAGTWFAFAAITPVMLAFWLWRQRRAPLAPRPRSD